MQTHTGTYEPHSESHQGVRDVVVVGAGNAALCAALAAREGGADVLVLERAGFEERGGNTSFTAGAMRVSYEDVDELMELLPELGESERANTDFGIYPKEQFYEDMARVTNYRADPDLVEILVEQNRQTLLWMQSKGVRFVPIYGRQAFQVDGGFKFWGGLTVEVAGGGIGLVESLVDACTRSGIEILYNARARELLHSDEGVQGVVASVDGRTTEIRSRSVVLAAGGFEANAEWRSRYLGQHWDLAKVRGSRFNTGDGIRMALDVGAMPWGHWSGCHAVAWDRNAPDFGDLTVGDAFSKLSYPLGIMVNENGQRFVDEGADFRNYTYAKYGQEILKQPQQVAGQIFDRQVEPLLRDEYRIQQVTKITAQTIEELAEGMDGVDAARLIETIRKFNEAIDRSVAFDPNVKDGLATVGLDVPKSNWANPIEEPPFYAFQTTCGVTFTFGGLRISTKGEVLDTEAEPIPGLYAAGELVGGLFYFNYPGGSGLTAGSVFGRLAGVQATTFAQTQKPEV